MAKISKPELLKDKIQQIQTIRSILLTTVQFSSYRIRHEKWQKKSTVIVLYLYSTRFNQTRGKILFIINLCTESKYKNNSSFDHFYVIYQFDRQEAVVVSRRCREFSSASLTHSKIKHLHPAVDSHILLHLKTAMWFHNWYKLLAVWALKRMWNIQNGLVRYSKNKPKNKFCFMLIGLFRY